ncbi:Monocarboxylate transporter [Echinococcus granulosus]|uniref:Monocarboxylate transporter n=1 Tax=Echinococcus granulosus TaxID=6210 RepID=W6UHS5_ECHGR|nr:Monocarboxylate transporter [Echinococcus granulosus]EUB61045.1 Monocarboxylate transporter [Echinococcus granulosus]
MSSDVNTKNTVKEKGDLQSEMDDKAKELEINLEEIELPVPPDGGWSWAVLLGSFICMFCVDGLSFSFGVLLSDLQTSFECTTTKISVASSLIVGFTLISGPVVSAVSNILSFRSLVLVGSGISFCSVLACAFVYDVNIFIVLFGFVTVGVETVSPNRFTNRLAEFKTTIARVVDVPQSQILAHFGRAVSLQIPLISVQCTSKVASKSYALADDSSAAQRYTYKHIQKRQMRQSSAPFNRGHLCPIDFTDLSKPRRHVRTGIGAGTAMHACVGFKTRVIPDIVVGYQKVSLLEECTSYGMIYLPAATIVSQWFAKLRATATGISMCGSSIGTAVYSAILPKLLKIYSWRGCMAIMAAMSLHCFAAGCLFIPLRDYQRGHPVKKSETEREAEVEDASSRPKNGLSDARFRRSVTPNLGSVAESGYLKHADTDPESPTPVLLKVPKLDRSDPLSHRVPNFPASVVKDLLESQSIHGSGDMVRIQGIEKHQPPMVGLSTVNRVVGEVLSHQDHSRTQSSRRRTVSVEPSPGASVYVKTGGNQLFASAVSLRPIADAGVHVDPFIRREIVHKLEREMDLPANRKDFFYSASMVHVNEYVSSSNVNEYIRSVTKIGAGEIEEEGTVARPPNHVLKMLSELFDFGLLRSPTFLLLLASSVFGLLGYPVPYVFLSDEAQTLGYSSEASANLLVYLSSVNTVGRVMAGVISDWPCTDALFVNNAALIISGVACVVLPLMPSYIGHVAYAVTFGLAIAAFVSLRIILLVEMLGLERLTNAFGFLLLFQGLAFIVSPPILASFYDLLKSYNYTFILGGASLILSALLCFPLRPILRWERRRRGEVVPPHESGHCIRLVRHIRDRFTV